MLWAKAVTLRLVTTSSIRTNDETILHSFFILPPPLIAEWDCDAPGICYRACRLTLNGGRQNFDGKCVFRIFRIRGRAIQQATLCRSIGSDRIRIVIVAADFLPLAVRVNSQIVAVPRRDGGDNAAIQHSRAVALDGDSLGLGGVIGEMLGKIVDQTAAEPKGKASAEPRLDVFVQCRIVFNVGRLLYLRFSQLQPLVAVEREAVAGISCRRW